MTLWKNNESFLVERANIIEPKLHETNKPDLT